MPGLSFFFSRHWILGWPLFLLQWSLVSLQMYGAHHLDIQFHLVPMNAKCCQKIQGKKNEKKKTKHNVVLNKLYLQDLIGIPHELGRFHCNVIARGYTPTHSARCTISSGMSGSVLTSDVVGENEAMPTRLMAANLN